jgi:hypothetical protein
MYVCVLINIRVFMYVCVPVSVCGGVLMYRRKSPRKASTASLTFVPRTIARLHCLFVLNLGRICDRCSKRTATHTYYASLEAVQQVPLAYAHKLGQEGLNVEDGLAAALGWLSAQQHALVPHRPVGGARRMPHAAQPQPSAQSPGF